MSHDESSSYREKAKKLKALGLVNWDLRKPLSRGKKSYITKLTAQKEGEKHPYSDLVNSPSRFIRLRADKKFLKNAKEADYITGKDSIFIRRKPFIENVRIKDGVLHMTERQGNGRLEYKIYLPGTKEFFQVSKRLSEQPRDKTEYLTLKIGANSPFNRVFNNTGELLNYLSSFKLKDKPGRHWEELLPEIALVKLHI